MADEKTYINSLETVSLKDTKADFSNMAVASLEQLSKDISNETVNSLETISVNNVSDSSNLINQLKENMASSLNTINTLQTSTSYNVDNASFFNELKTNLNNSLETVNAIEKANIGNETSTNFFSDLKGKIENNIAVVNSLDTNTIDNNSTTIIENLKQELFNNVNSIDDLVASGATDVLKPTIESIKLNNDGSFSFNDKKLSNDELSEIFDYTKIKDEKQRSYVEGIFKSKTVTINGVKYSTKLNEKGQLVSKDGKHTIKRAKLEKLFGEIGYKALVLKTTKDITVTDDKLKVKNKDKKVTLDLSSKERLDDKKTSTSIKEKKKGNKKSSAASVAVGSPSSSYGGSYSSSYSGSYSGGGSSYSTDTSTYTEGNNNSNINSDGNNDQVFQFKTQIGNGDVILVDFSGLSTAIDNLKSLKGNLTSVVTSYNDDIGEISGNDFWTGDDKDFFVTQKKTYSSNLSDFESTLDEFITCLENYNETYTNLENTLAAKTIS